MAAICIQADHLSIVTNKTHNTAAIFANGLWLIVKQGLWTHLKLTGISTIHGQTQELKGRDHVTDTTKAQVRACFLDLFFLSLSAPFNSVWTHEMRTMWKAAALMFVLLHTDMQVIGDLDKPETEMSKLENQQQTDGISPSHAASSAYSGKLLVVPMDGSHWVTMKAISQEMGRRGHRVTVVIPEVSIRMGPGKHYDTVTHPVPYDQAHIDSVMAMNKEMIQKCARPFLEKMKTRFSKFQKVAEVIHTTAESLLFNASLISQLAQQGFDAVLTDPMIPTGALIARKFGIPTVNLLRGIPCSLDVKSAGCPAPPSYVPRFLTGHTDTMNFKQRVVNTLVALLEPLFCRLLFWRFDKLAYEFLGEEVGIAEVLSDSDIWLMRWDFTLEFPRPLMPNVVLVGGINCNVRAPLPEHLESWVSGEHGFVVFTLGTMVSDFPEETASIFLEAFRQIPQKVIWRYTGQVPDNVPENVKIMSWVPQNDLLAHSGARAFITHAGSHGLFEGLCHAVPMVMLPIGGDQPDNAKRLASRGVGVELDIFSITTEILLQALNEVIHDVRYRENIQKLSALHKDRPTKPLDLAVYWTEYVMRHKGAKHLKSAGQKLNWIQYFCLDVMLLLATVALVLGILTAKCMKLCYRKLSRKTKLD